MDRCEYKSTVWTIFSLFSITLLGLYYYGGKDDDFFAIVNNITKAISINLVLLAIFIKWLWRLNIFRGWLVKIPNLNGEWSGKINTTYDGKKEIHINVLINQTFLNTNICMSSDEMESNSFSTSFFEDNGQKKLCYSYISCPKANYREDSPIHMGTTILTFDSLTPTVLKGEYWTSRKTVGEIELSKT